jgi:acyl carrier protein
MTKELVFGKVQEIFRDIFDDDKLVIQDSTNSSDIDDWDSLNHINLVVAIENELGIKFDLGELSSLKDVASMIELILIKLNN